MIDCFSNLDNGKLFVNPDGTLKKEAQLMCFLMNTTGVYSLNSKKDIWLLCYRLYIVYGARLSFEELFLNELFFAANYGEYDMESDFDKFASATISDGLRVGIATDELILFIGFSMKNKVNSDNVKFEKKLILKAKRFWILKNERTILFPITLRDPKLRIKLLKGKKIGKQIKKQANDWADLVTKYL